MERKQFIATTLCALPLFAFAKLPGHDRREKTSFIIRSGNNRIGKPMLYKGVHPNNVLISRKDTDNSLSVFAFTGFSRIGPSLHMHYHQDEFFHVVEGKYRFLVGEDLTELNEGDTIFLPRKVPHTWLQLTEKGRLIYAVNPAGTLEDFFVEMNDLTAPPTEEQSKAIHKRHGMKLLGPPLDH
jgi:mannose-6-phosphate isomerase-like protein (cupin superfamily)